MAFRCYLLITTAFGILSIHEVYESVYKPFAVNDRNAGVSLERETSAGNDNVYVNPGGPLNLLHGYLLKENAIFSNKRLFSPALKINYKLTYNGNTSIFSQDNT
ncbi:hypothetical protein PAEPH01_2508, partial [Pancytospora epiphaga]